MQRNRKIPNKKEQEKGRRKSAKVNKKIRGNRRKQEGMTEETFSSELFMGAVRTIKNEVEFALSF